ncbi:unnamed protein product, partial [Laminaria digitata]
QGELGWSSRHQAPVRALIAQRLPNTLALMGPAFFIALCGALVLGGLAATRPRSGWDRLARTVCTLGLALPAHWLGLLVLGGFAVGLGWLPSGGVQSLEDPGWGSRALHLVLPVSVLCLYYVARWTRFLQSALRSELSAGYLDTARAMGLSYRRAVLTQALPNALFPLLTVVAQSMPVLFSGALVVERVVADPGMG